MVVVFALCFFPSERTGLECRVFLWRNRDDGWLCGVLLHPRGGLSNEHFRERARAAAVLPDACSVHGLSLRDSLMAGCSSLTLLAIHRHVVRVVFVVLVVLLCASVGAAYTFSMYLRRNMLFPRGGRLVIDTYIERADYVLCTR